MIRSEIKEQEQQKMEYTSTWCMCFLDIDHDFLEEKMKERAGGGVFHSLASWFDVFMTGFKFSKKIVGMDGRNCIQSRTKPG